MSAGASPPYAQKQSLVSVVAEWSALVSAEVCMWLDPCHRQAKDNEKNSVVDGSLTNCGDAQKESENKAFIQVFHPIQSVKSTNKVMLRYTRVSQKSGNSTLA